ncbi:hypothetical protein [Curtobacterium aetherium]|uniref:hypothetical protein n=1 Tax=Curtobacterium aetherium TaxID=2841594 RepID=UPI003461226B
MSRRRTWTEITVVLMLSLGASALWSVLQIIDDLSQTTPLGEQSTALNSSTTTVQYVDLARQLLGIAVDLAPVALVCMLLWSSSRPHLGRLGIDRFRVRPDLGGAALMALGIGIPGLALYFGGRALGITVAVDRRHWTRTGGRSRSCCSRPSGRGCRRRSSSSATSTPGWATSGGVGGR